MRLKLIESEKNFSEDEIKDLERLLSKLPASHLQTLDRIERIVGLSEELAISYLRGAGGEMQLTDEFYNLNEKDRAKTFYHELGHIYFDYLDEIQGNRSVLKQGPCNRNNVKHLLRVQWMEIGQWELEPENLKKIKKLKFGNATNFDKYVYMVMYDNPNHRVGEWTCPVHLRIPSNGFMYSFKYGQPFYSPKEEMADAYALFPLDREHFSRCTERNPAIRAKFDFMKEYFIDTSTGRIEFVKDSG